MRVHVKNQTVRKNIELFKQLLERQNYVDVSLDWIDNKSYSALVNRLSGILVFEEAEEKPEIKLNLREWKPIRIDIKLSCLERDEGVFEIFEDSLKEDLFHRDDLEPLAYRILSETFKILNHLSRKYESRFYDIQSFLDLLSHVELEEGIKKMEGNKDLVHEAWHQVDRVKAEQILSGKEPGVFLFRKDDYAAILEEQLRKQFKESIKCLTITYVDEEKKICDKTIVLRNHRWMFYNDDPNLSGITYGDIYSLLESLSDLFKVPYLIKNVA